MSSNSSYSLVNLGDLSKPAVVLIEKISDAIGGLFAPWQTRRNAAAERDAMVIRAKAKERFATIEAISDIQITDLHRRATNRLLDEEARRQKNIEDITAGALPNLKENASPDSIENDWLVNFFEKCRIVSDNQMQGLWSRILAGEANTPGTFSKRTVNFLSDLDKAEAELFTTLCGFVWYVSSIPIPFVLDEKNDIYAAHGINFYALDQLDGIGLVQFRTTGHVLHMDQFSGVTPSYYGKTMVLDMSKVANKTLNIGKVLLTKTGEELVPICGSQPVDGFYEYVRNHWAGYLP